MKLMRSILAEKRPEFIAFSKLRSAVQAERDGIQRIADYRAALDEAHKQARLRFHSDRSLDAFKNFVEAGNRMRDIEREFLEVAGAGTSFAESVFSTPEAQKTMTVALTTARDLLSKRIDAAAAAEREALIESGFEPSGESPTIAAMRQHVGRIAEVIDHVKHYDGDGERHPWQDVVQLLSAIP